MDKIAMKSLPFYLFLVLILMTQNASGTEKIVKMALFHYYPFLLKDSPDKGYAYDIAKYIFEKAGYTVEDRFFPINRAISSVVKKESDIILGLSPIHSPELEYSKTPITSLKFYIWGKKELKWRYHSRDSLKNVKILSVGGFNYSLADPIYQNYLESNADNVLFLFGKTAIQRAFIMINVGRADVFSLDIDQAFFILTSMGLYENFQKVGELKKPYLGFMGVSKSHLKKSEFIEIFDKGMAEIRKSPVLENILHKYVTNYNLKHIPFDTRKN